MRRIIAQSAAAALAAALLARAARPALKALLRGALARHEAKLGRREGEELMRDPDFVESVAQMARGEGTIARTRDEEERE